MRVLGLFPCAAKPSDQHGALFLIVLIGLGLRLYDLGTESLWRDEIISIQVAQLDLSQISDNRAANFHPPFYYFLLHYWLKLLGSSEFAARLLSVLCGTLAILLFHRIGTYLFSERLGLLGALIFALAEFQVHYAQEVKGYALFTLLNLCSFYFLLLFLQQRSLRGVSGYVVSTALLLYTHAYGLFSLTAQNLYVFSIYLFSQGANKAYKSKIISWLSVQGLLFLLFLPWLGVLVDQEAVSKMPDRRSGGCRYWAKATPFLFLRPLPNQPHSGWVLD